MVLPLECDDQRIAAEKKYVATVPVDGCDHTRKIPVHDAGEFLGALFIAARQFPGYCRKTDNGKRWVKTGHWTYRRHDRQPRAVW